MFNDFFTIIVILIIPSCQISLKLDFNYQMRSLFGVGKSHDDDQEEAEMFLWIFSAHGKVNCRDEATSYSIFKD